MLFGESYNPKVRKQAGVSPGSLRSGALRPGGIRLGVLTAAALLAITAAAGCGEARDKAPKASAPATSPGTAEGSKEDGPAKKPAPGLPAALTAQRLGWATCPPPSAAQGGGDAPGRSWQCVTMKAPLDYHKPDGETIDVALIRKKAIGPRRKQIGSLVFNFGGPGESGIALLPEYAEDYAELSTRYDLVSFDPRGVGNTATVTCGDESEQDPTRYAAACHRHSGKVLPYVGTSNTARDMDLMRRLLGEDKLHYFGFSYGTELGGVYAHLFPKSMGRAVFDAAVDPTEDQVQATLSQAKGFQLAFDHFAEYCADTYDNCPTGSNPKQATKRVGELLDTLEKKPATTNTGEDLGPELAVRGIANALYDGEDGWDFLMDALAEIRDQGTGNDLLDSAYAIVSETAPSRAGAPRRATPDETPAGNSVAARTAITCADSDQRLHPLDIDNKLREFEKASPLFGEFSAQPLYDCMHWPVDGERTSPDVSANGGAPILVIGNTGDPATPYPGSKHMAEELGKDVGVHLTVEGEGHTTYGYYDCVTRTVNAYLLDGKIPRSGTRCS